MKRAFGRSALALCLALFAAPRLFATPLPPDQVTWTYNWVPGQAAVLSTNTPTGSVTFTNEPQQSATGSTDIVATNLRVASTLPANDPNVISPGGHYTLSLTLGVVEEGVVYSGSHTFGGTLSHSFSAESANVQNVFDPGEGSAWTYSLGSYDFAVTLNAYTPPGPPNQVQTGAISANVVVTLRDGGGPPVLNETPEPSSLVLGSFAVSALGFGAWRRRTAPRLSS